MRFEGRLGHKWALVIDNVFGALETRVQVQNNEIYLCRSGGPSTVLTLA